MVLTEAAEVLGFFVFGTRRYKSRLSIDGVQEGSMVTQGKRGQRIYVSMISRLSQRFWIFPVIDLIYRLHDVLT